MLPHVCVHSPQGDDGEKYIPKSLVPGINYIGLSLTYIFLTNQLYQYESECTHLIYSQNQCADDIFSKKRMQPTSL